MIMRRLVDKYHKLPKSVKASMWFIFASVIQKGIAFITTPIFTRIMSTEQYGMFSVYQSWYSIIFIFTSVNFAGGVYNNGLLKYEEDRDNFTSSLLFTTTVITIAFFIIYIININFFNTIFGLSTFFIVFMFIQLLFEPAYLLWSAKLRFDYNYIPLIVISCIIAFLTPISGIVMVLLTQFKAEARVVSYVVIQSIIFANIYIHIFKKGNKFCNINYIRYALKFNIPLIPHYLSMTILNQADRLMIQHFCGNNYVAIYSVAYALSMIISIITTAINNSFIPFLYKSINSGEISKIRVISRGLVTCIGILCFIPVLLGPELISLMASEKYAQAVWIIPSVSISVYFIFLYNMFGTIEFYYEQNKFIMVASCVGAILNIILNLIFIPKFGFVAAGYTTLLCYIVFSVAHGLFYFKIKYDKSIDDVYDVKFIIMFSFVIILFMILFTVLYNNTIIRYLSLIVLVLIAVGFGRKIKDNFLLLFEK